MKTNAQLVYRLIPYVHRAVKSELCIQKWTGMSTAYMLKMYNEKQQTIFLQFEKKYKYVGPNVRVFPTHLIGYINLCSKNEYVMLTNKGEWVKYKNV